MIQRGQGYILQEISMQHQVSQRVMTREEYFEQLELDFRYARNVNDRRLAGENIPEFDVRSRPYDSALRYSPHARDEDFVYLRKWLKPQPGEVGADFAAGTGLITFPTAEVTGATTYAIDPSKGQLEMLERERDSRGASAANVVPIHVFPDSKTFFEEIEDKYDLDLEGQLDYITSYGGIHHSMDQLTLFSNGLRMLRPGGRIVVADVGMGTSLARYFDNFVSPNCLTGHVGNWLSRKRLHQLSQELPMKVTRVKLEPVTWHFEDILETSNFLKGLHCDDRSSLRQISDGVEKYLKYKHEPRIHDISMNWHMLFSKMVKTEGRVAV